MYGGPKIWKKKNCQSDVFLKKWPKMGGPKSLAKPPGGLTFFGKFSKSLYPPYIVNDRSLKQKFLKYQSIQFNCLYHKPIIEKLHEIILTAKRWFWKISSIMCKRIKTIRCGFPISVGVWVRVSYAPWIKITYLKTPFLTVLIIGG